MEAFLSALLVAIITTFVQWRIAKKDRESREKERLDKFRLAALEKRLEIHQEAFYRWNQMMQLIHKSSEKKSDYLIECQEWYYRNSLYLDDSSRVEFKMCINNVFDYQMYWNNWQQAERGTKAYEDANNQLKFIFGRIQNTGEIIAKGVDINFKNIKDFDEEDKKINKLEKELND